jgi:DNA invertase Pin-like site-specific DNA recombinase
MNNGLDTNLRYFIYCRKSSESRDRQALSIEAQIRELSEFAKIQGLTIVDVFEESQTAFKLGRPIFNQMVAKLEAGLANAILTWKPDRLARNAFDGGRIIQTIDDGIIQEIRTPYECFRQEDNRLMLYIHFGMSNDYSRQISANVKRGNRQKYARKEFVGKAPVGYLNEKVGNSRNIIPDPIKAPLVRRLFEECATSNYSVIQLAGMANKWGLTSVYGRQLYKSEMYTLLKRTARN